MQFYQKNHRVIVVYGVGSGNVPALSNCSVGHLWTTFFDFLKTISYEQSGKSTRTGARRC